MAVVGRGMFFGFNSRIKHQYTNGDCWVLAWELHQRGGFSLYVLSRELLNPARIRATWDHVVVKVGEDAFMDITGVLSGDEMEIKWNMVLSEMAPENTATFEAFENYLWGPGSGTDPDDGNRYHEFRGWDNEPSSPAVIAQEIMEAVRAEGLVA